MEYTVVDICVGGIIVTPEVLSKIGEIMSEYPSNVIGTQYRGTDPSCQITNFTPKPKPIDVDNLPDGAASFPWAIVTVIFIFGLALL